MKFLVIGANSFVGSRILDEIKSQGYSSIGTYHSNSPRDASGFVKFDILTDSLRSVLPPGFLSGSEKKYGVICSALPQIDLCKREKNMTRQVNVIATERIIDEMASLDMVPVFLSTSYVYSGTRGRYTENDEVHPSCEYAKQKREVEAYLEATSKQFLTFRCDKILSYSRSGKHLFSEWQELIEHGKPIMCIKDQVMSPTFAEDLGKVIMVSCKKNLSGTYHMSSGEYVSRAELASKFVEAKGIRWEIIEKDVSEFNFDETRPLRTGIDNSKLAIDTGFKFTSLDEGIRKFLKNLA
jgi:dTDP-4-dehydrorhamnose reductase